MAWSFINLKKLVLRYPGGQEQEIAPCNHPDVNDELTSEIMAHPLNGNGDAVARWQYEGEAAYYALSALGVGTINLFAIYPLLSDQQYIDLYNPKIGHDRAFIRFIKNQSTYYSFSVWAYYFGQRITLQGRWQSTYRIDYQSSLVKPEECGIGFLYDSSNGNCAYFSQLHTETYPGSVGSTPKNCYIYCKGGSNSDRIQACLSALITGNIEEGGGGGVGPYDDGGISEPGGGDPDEQHFDEESDEIGEPTLPTFTATGSGMVTAYVPTLSEMNDIADYLIDPNIIQVLAGTVLKLSDVIIGLNLFPFSVPASQSKVVSLNLMGARLGTGITCHYADQQFITLDMGSIQIEKCWDNCLDFNPYTRISIFLPFCGYYELDTDEVMGRTVNVKYKVDIMTGSCVALVIVDGSVMYQFAGQCASQIPVSSVSFDGMISSMIDLGMTVASAQAAVGGAAAAAEEASDAFFAASNAGISTRDFATLGGRMADTSANLVDVKSAAGRQMIGATANAILSSKGFYSHAGGLSSAPGFLGVRKPFIIKKIPKQSIPEGYGRLRGYPSNITSKLEDLSGYTEVEEIQLNIPNATVAEISECERILKAGCYL